MLERSSAGIHGESAGQWGKLAPTTMATVHSSRFPSSESSAGFMASATVIAGLGRRIMSLLLSSDGHVWPIPGVPAS